MKQVRLLAILALVAILGLLLSPVALALTRPIVSPLSTTSITHNTVVLNAIITDDGGENADSRGFVWDTTNRINPGSSPPASSGYSTNWSENGNFTTGTFSHETTSLTPNTTYYFRAFAHNSQGYAYSDEGTFLTLETPTKWENYTTGDDSSAQAFGSNRFAQTFTPTSTHTVRFVKLKLFRQGTPGYLWVSIKPVNDEGHPYGEDWTTGYLDGGTLTTDTDGAWYTLDFSQEINLAGNATYAIVVRLLGGNETNFVGWRYDATGTYAGGNYEASTNGGETWTAQSDSDFMFEVWGVQTLKIYSVKAFASFVESGDWLIVILYKNTVPPAYPAENPATYFSVVLGNGTSNFAKVPLPAWGYKPTAIYISNEANNNLSWGTNYTLSIAGRTEKWGNNTPTVSHVMSYSDWVGSNLFVLDYWVRKAARDIEAYYGIDAYTEEIPTQTGVKDLPKGEGVLTLYGGEIFQKGIPFLHEVRPHLFYFTIYKPTIPIVGFTGEYEKTLKWEDQVGPQITSLLNDIGGLFNLNGRIIGGLLVFTGYIAVAALGYKLVPHPVISIALSVPMLLIGWYLGLIPLAIAGVLSAIILLMVVWLLWWSRT